MDSKENSVINSIRFSKMNRNSTYASNKNIKICRNKLGNNYSNESCN